VIIDANIYLGNWALRRVAGGSAAEVIQMMDSFGIGRAFVSSMNGVMYRNVQEANIELLDGIGRETERLVPFAVISPAYPGWADDIVDCFEEFGFRGVKIHPGYHGYRLSDEQVQPFFSQLEEMGIPVSYSARMEEGIEHWALRGLENPTGNELDKLLSDFPGLRLLITDLIGFDDIFGQLVPRPNLWLDISHLRRADELETMIGRFGARRLVYGSSYPFRCINSPLNVMEYARISDDDRQAIMGLNAEKYFSGDE
jgi:predicted TIM-barrel fold metal-dependent hydrolase